MNSQTKVDGNFKISQSRLHNGDVWTFEKPEVLDLKNKINTKGIPIKNIPHLKIYIGITTGYNEAFVIDEKTKAELIDKDPRSIEIIKPLLRGRDIKKWQANYQKLYVISCYHNVPISDYPFIKDYLKVFRKDLENRAQVVRGDHVWYELDNNPAFYLFNRLEKPKIIWSEISQKPQFTVDYNSYFSLNTVYILTIENDDENNGLNYFPCVLNSKLLYWQFKHH